MTVVNPKSISGINSITTGSGSDDILTIHNNNGTERLRIDSTGTTKIVTGIVTTLTATTGIVTTLTTNTLTANSTAKVGSGVTLSPDGDVFVTGVTTSSTVNVGAAVTISESGIEASGIGITCASINGTQIGGRRNIIINGAMNVAQRGTSSTANGYGSVDRIYVGNSGVDEAPTHAQVDVASGTTPYTLGFRKALKITNGNQTGGAGAADYIYFNAQAIEAQNLANSGWNHKSSSSSITLSFWVKSSVAQTFYFQFDVRDGTRYNYTMETGSLTADTWTKVTKTIPGNSNLTVDNDTGVGAFLTFGLFWGTDYTGSMSLETWAAASDSLKTPDSYNLWYSTNDATFEITGVQLEVGSQATPFEHRSFGEELALCQRYFERITVDSSEIFFIGVNQFGSGGRITHEFKVTKRAIPTVTIDDASYRYYAVAGSGSNGLANFDVAANTKERMQVGSNSAGASTSFWVNKESDGYIDASSEL